MLTYLEIFGVAEVFGVLPTPLVLRLAPASGAAAGGVDPDSGVSEQDSLMTRDIAGLEPVKADIITTRRAARGELMVGSSTGKRNIVLKIGLNPDWATQTMAELRQQVYAYFMPEQSVLLRFHSTHIPTCEIEGFIESLEPNIFSKDPEIVISIICPDPDFVSVDETVITGVVGEFLLGPMVDIDYPGSIETGFELKIESSEDTPIYSAGIYVVFGRDLGRRQTFAFSEIAIDTTKRFEMSSVSGNKYVRNVAIPSGDITNLLRQLDLLSSSGPEWPILTPKANVFRVGTNGDDDPGQDWTLTYFARFGGL